MTNEQILAVAAKYESELVSYPAEHQGDGFPPSGRESMLSHARWMCRQIRDHVAAGRTEKAMRWLGFVQGIMWASGTKSIEAMRGDNTAEVAPAEA